jgi:LysR family transcriptional regulator, glycine cleavage system transcriptional activator
MALVSRLLDEGKLVLASRRPPIETDYGYWLLARRDADSPALRAVQDWIKAEAAAPS